MGERWRKAQAKGYRQREDAAYRELIEPTIITACRRTEYKAAYRCRAAGDKPTVGTKVWLNIIEDEVRVYETTSLLGAVYPEEGTQLASVISNEMMGMAKAVIDSVSPLGDFTITCEPEGEE
ncbi:hypothetical protein [Hyalangium sp.]|uniref:hypothetical protein n=1 Tax=Hyalangium sp. TaxID=2028555 RepID=UPI002D306775|nr:hypothetical protein [Hyalangium sp.]HYI01899.1 hypothetical protein [Hyalangium sp.]